ncbi:N-acetylmuramoyl-L-alanine amidase [Streptomyces bugieae]|uniref:N-acetylmuramoyl-L-alanine amidase n=1 Tax=Streptomyces bugieae TaxID=3098223 RepID=A0ABU7NRG5_9ACTN|nr:N-acetylmuramoyl-L-alanine amidase [Streptomyces sp. DSM 41528]
MGKSRVGEPAAEQRDEAAGEQDEAAERLDGAQTGPQAGRRGGAAGVTRRRALWLAGGGAVAAGAVVATGWDELRHWWWQLPGNDLPRRAGEVDHRGAQWVAASGANYRRADRPADYPVDRVVIHVVQGSYATALRVFRNADHEAAAHYVVRKDGHIAQMVRELDVAFHAGNRGFNERSIGIEHEGFVDRPEGFTDAMYESSARLTADICRRYGFPADREHIVGHVEVPGTDHTDPGPHWDWDRYLRLVRAAGPRPEPARTGHP